MMLTVFTEKYQFDASLPHTKKMWHFSPLSLQTVSYDQVNIIIDIIIIISSSSSSSSSTSSSRSSSIVLLLV